MFNPVSNPFRQRPSLKNSREFGRGLKTMAILLLVGLVLSSLLQARGDDPVPLAAAIDDGFATRKAAADRITELDRQSFSSSVEGGLPQRAATMQEAADLAKSTFGEGHWLTRLKQSVADGLKSISDLPTPQQELFQDAVASQQTGYRLARQGKRDLALKQHQRAHERFASAIGPDHFITVYSLFGVASDENMLKAPDLSKQHALRIVPFAAEHWGKGSPIYAHALQILGAAEGQLREFESAERHLRDAIVIFEPVVAEGLSVVYLTMYARAHRDLARVLNEQGRFVEAELPARRATELIALHYPLAVCGEMPVSLLEVARSESGQGKFAQAEVTFVAVRRIQLELLNRELTACFSPIYEEHLSRIREAKGEIADKPVPSTADRLLNR